MKKILLLVSIIGVVLNAGFVFAALSDAEVASKSATHEKPTHNAVFTEKQILSKLDTLEKVNHNANVTNKQILLRLDALEKVNGIAGVTDNQILSRLDALEKVKVSSGTNDDLLSSRLDTLEKVKVSTWMDMAYYGSTEKGSVGTFDQSHVYATVENRLTDKMHGLFTIEWEHGLQIEGKDGISRGAVRVDSAWMAYHISDATNFKFGQFFNPMGYWLPTHWSILMESQERPLISENNYLPLQLVGVNYFGSAFLESSEVQYSAFISNGAEMFSDTSALDKNNAKALGADLRLLTDAYSAGAGVYYDKSSGNKTDVSYLMYGKYMGIDRFNFRTEVLMTNRTYTDALFNYYVNVNYEVSDIMLATVRYDYAKDKIFYPDEPLAWQSIPANTSTMLTYVLKYSPDPSVSFKVEASMHDEAGKAPFTSYGLITGMIF